MEQHRQLGLAATIAVVTGESIALGIFLTPAAMAKSLGSPLLLTAVWCGMGLIAMCGALCYSELAVRFPRAGGEYVYLREGYGSRVAFSMDGCRLPLWIRALPRRSRWAPPLMFSRSSVCRRKCVYGFRQSYLWGWHC